MSRTQDMTKGSPVKQMTLFALPLIAGNIGQQLYMVADSVIVGRGVGSEALAAVGATDWTYWLILWVVQALTQGFAARVSQHIGARDEEKVRKSIAMSVVLCVVLSILLTAVSLLIAAPMLRILGTPENIFGSSEVYLKILFAGTGIVMAYNMAAAVLRAFGDGRTPLIGIVIAACTNIVLDLLFVFGFRWGVAGAAIATVAAQLLAFLYCLVSFAKMSYVKLERTDWSFSSTTVRTLLSLGFPMALQNIFIAVGGMILQSAINRHGFLYVAGFTATNKLYGLLESSSLAFGFAVTTYMAQNYGAGLYDRIRKGMKSIAVIGLAMSVTVCVLMLIFGRPLLGMFISSADENAAEVLDIAYHYLRIMSIFLPTLYLLNGYRSMLQGLGRGIAVMISGIVEFVMRVSVALVFSRIWEGTIFYAEPGAWTATAVYLILACIVVFRRLTGAR